mmetsp:Transcript_13494/g.41663  ORF Transcript_13494/g.41663 Transcript_13494/m.41663 type:complete len:271 (-) Transcript_13494:79-891(-)
MMEPGARACAMAPASPVLRAMIIFIASTSTYGVPASRCVPSSCRKRTILPVTSVRSSDGSKIVGMRHVTPSQMTRRPSGSSMPWILRVAPPNDERSDPSGCSRTFARRIWPFKSTTKTSGPALDTLKSYFKPSYVMVCLKPVRSLTRTVESWPLASAATSSACFSFTNVCDRKRTAARTKIGVFIGTAMDFSRRMPSSQPVWISFALKASVSKSSTRYSTGLRILPRISTDLSASTRWRRAISRVAPDAKMWPNCESANSWMPPFAPTEK